PVRFELARVPRPRELPPGLERQRLRIRESARIAPVTGVLFRPEEEHRRSGEDDVLPPLARGQGELHDDAVERADRIAREPYFEGNAAHVGAVAEDDAVGPKRRGDAERVPGAERRPVASACADLEVRRAGG